MKTPLKFFTAVLAIVFIGVLATRSGVILAQQAATQQDPVPVIVNPAPKHYRVVDIGRFAVANGQNAAGTLENILNEVGAQGWRVVATSGTFVILMQ